MDEKATAPAKGHHVEGEQVSADARLYILSILTPLGELHEEVARRIKQAREAAVMQAAVMDEKPLGEGWVLELDRMRWMRVRES